MLKSIALSLNFIETVGPHEFVEVGGPHFTMTWQEHLFGLACFKAPDTFKMISSSVFWF